MIWKKCLVLTTILLKIINCLRLKKKTITIRILQTLSLLVSAEEQTSTLYNQ